MHLLEAFARTYAVAGRLPDPLVTRGLGMADPAPTLSVAAYRAITAVTEAAGWVACQFRRRRTRRATVRDLQSLDDRMLADIGLPRSAIKAVASAAVDRNVPPCARRAETKITAIVATAVANRPAANDNSTRLAA